MRFEVIMDGDELMRGRHDNDPSLTGAETLEEAESLLDNLEGEIEDTETGDIYTYAKLLTR